jgi:hypothetical protein
VVASEHGSHAVAVPIVAVTVCFVIRLAGVFFDLGVPRVTGHEPGGLT